MIYKHAFGVRRGTKKTITPYCNMDYSLALLSFCLFFLVFASALDYEEKPRGQVIKFTSGDDLEDDFMGDERHKQNRDKSSLTESNDTHIESKKRQGPKVINFVGWKPKGEVLCFI